MNSSRIPCWIALTLFSLVIPFLVKALINHLDPIAIAILMCAAGGWFLAIGVLTRKDNE